MRMYTRLLLGLVGRTLRSRSDLLMENLVLRQQLAVYARRRTKPQLHQEDRVFWSVVARGWQSRRVVGWQNPVRTLRARLLRDEALLWDHRTSSE